MNTASRTLKALILGSFLLLAAPAQAVVLPPFSTNTPLPGTTLAARPELAGTVIADALVPVSFPDAAGGVISFTVQTRVVQETVAGTLDFYYRIRDFNPGTSGGIYWLSVGRFYTFLPYDVDFRTDGLGQVPSDYASRAVAKVIEFHFPLSPDGSTAVLVPGEESLFLFVKTTATTMSAGQGFVFAGPTPAGATLIKSPPFPIYVPGNWRVLRGGPAPLPFPARACSVDPPVTP
jgi:hypothetical protein